MLSTLDIFCKVPIQVFAHLFLLGCLPFIIINYGISLYILDMSILCGLPFTFFFFG